MAESSPLAHSPTLVAAPGSGDDALARGAAVGEFIVEGFLGAGAMGEVYAGIHPVIGKKVAIKVLKREVAASPDGAERFKREARAVNQVDHPNVIDIFSFGRLDDGRLFLVMDLVEGRSLRKALVEGPLEVEVALEILAAIADALDAAHARGVIHRDLKPDNVMLGRGTPPTVHVLDFGLAKLLDGRGHEPAGLDADRPGDVARHARLHGPGAVERGRCRPRLRPLLARGDGLRAAQREPPVPGRQPAADDGAALPREGAGAVEPRRHARIVDVRSDPRAGDGEEPRRAVRHRARDGRGAARGRGGAAPGEGRDPVGARAVDRRGRRARRARAVGRRGARRARRARRRWRGRAPSARGAGQRAGPGRAGLGPARCRAPP